ncbi:RagB/SusD family nutrient uptake outer membrane protein [Mucilaginibacter paludis]|uniref:RagB/SusD domain-containing protein n=1 Tax=Mucilaginibacter paludis DSM 18603 TaxID=714943 RepID=H1Y5A6_9SPHI|nr:RagB/SusD family nutrient uptake outer membrane protein [Mucilaginibacter paludis]EHQ28917.1 RagB/SusD domain-containing protein [Mucilaginibacter paludis DSM 18603]
MKKILILLIISGSFFTSCNKLDEKPYSLVTPDGLTTASDATALVSGVYASLIYDPGEQPIYGRNINFLADMTTDDWAAGPAAINANVQALSRDIHDASNDRVLAIWRQHYQGIGRANTAIDIIGGLSIDPVLRLRLAREAKFLRALLYFNLVRFFGAIPLVLHTSTDLTNLKTPRSAVDVVYTQIIADLTDAENLPAIYTGTDKGRATSGAAKALLAKVYLTRRNWDGAIAKAAEVINNKAAYGYDLPVSFADNFDYTKRNSGEIIYATDFTLNASLVSYNYLFASSWPSATGNRADVPADISLYSLYASNDIRRAKTFYTSKVALVGTNPTVFTYAAPGYFNKYVTDAYAYAGINGYAAPISFPVLRYADLLLIYAEALNEKNNGPTAAAFEALNEVRRRAFSQPIYSPGAYDVTALTNGTYTGFQDAVWLERRLELACEANRWFDLVRETRDGKSRLVSEVSKIASKTAVSERNNLFPIPQSQRDLDPEGLPQNPGYGN